MPFPVPVRKYVQGRLLRIPVAPVQIEPVLGNAGEVNDPEQGAVTGPAIVIRSGLPEIIETSPDKLTDAIGQIFVEDEIVLRQVRPVAMFEVVRRALVIIIFCIGFPRRRKFINPP
jgi:hypothetical protein